jgi:hypothetical protein
MGPASGETRFNASSTIGAKREFAQRLALHFDSQSTSHSGAISQALTEN